MAQKRIALVTSSKYPRLTDDDRILASALEGRGARAEPAVWDSLSVPWEQFDLALLRSPWDYHLHAMEFAAWITAVSQRTRLLNPPPLVRWNMNKRYLHALGEQGAQVLPSIVVEAGAPLPLEQVSQAGWTDVVVKPLVGASAWQIARTRTTELAQAITPELRLHGYLIQPFLPEVAEGEYSLVFLEGEFSHMAVKKPQAGDFRVQHELGGSLQRADADVAMIEAAASLFALFPVSPVYARIDGVRQNGRFLLMEAELIEPELYFRLAPEAAERFADILLA